MKPPKQIVKKVNTKELEPGSLRARFAETVVRQSKYILAAILILLALLGIFLGWKYYRAGLEEKAAALEYQAMAAYREASTSEDKPHELYTKAIEIYNLVLNRYPGTKSAERALFYSANSYFLSGKYDEAINLFSQYVEKYPQGEFFTDSLKGIGYAYEQKGDYQKALETYQQLQNKVYLASAKVDLFLAIARCQEALGQNQEAIATYEKLQADIISPMWKRTIEERLNALKPK